MLEHLDQGWAFVHPWSDVRLRACNPRSGKLLGKQYCCVPCRLAYLCVLEDKRRYSFPLVMPDAVFLRELNIASSTGYLEILKGLDDGLAIGCASVLDRRQQ